MTGDVQGLEIEDDSFIGTTVADEPLTEMRDEGNAVDALEVRDDANNLTSVLCEIYRRRDEGSKLM
ncbi:MAG: hypothetical protein DMG39_24180 [Acidobacteria bacterium]|nr:MAG: hypothetical protein DMG39_24180 [Acidobacteriota bacterium]